MATKHHSSKTHGGSIFETMETPRAIQVESTFLIDLRREPRFDTHFPGEAFSESGEHVSVTITNVSASGLRLEGCRQSAVTLLSSPNRRAPDTDSQTSLEVHFSLPTDSDHLDPVKVRCRAVYRRAKEDTYQIGMKVVTFEEGRAAFAEYLSYRGELRKIDRHRHPRRAPQAEHGAARSRWSSSSTRRKT